MTDYAELRAVIRARAILTDSERTAILALLDELDALRRDFEHFAPYFEAGVRALCPDPTSERLRLDAARARHKEEA